MDKKEKITKCSIDGCAGKGQIKKNDRIVFVKGLCHAHYTKLIRHGDPLYVEPRITKCSIPNCEGAGRMKPNGTIVFPQSYCALHYSRWLKHGDPLFTTRVMGEDRMANPLYRIYWHIKSRCYNKNCKQYHYYGGRGIKMSDEWLSDFNVFCTDMGQKPSKQHSIERIDVNGNYCKENCCFATSHQQAANRRNNNKNVGVRWCKKSRKWRAEIRINGKQNRLGVFVNEQDAINVRREMEIKYNVYEENSIIRN